MSPDLEKLIELYAKLHTAPADQRDGYFKSFEQACEGSAHEMKIDARKVMAFVKRKHFESIASENKRKGRPTEKR